MHMPPELPAGWNVAQPVLIADTFSSCVWKVRLPSGTAAIVKALKSIEDIADELPVQTIWRGAMVGVQFDCLAEKTT